MQSVLSLVRLLCVLPLAGTQRSFSSSASNNNGFSNANRLSNFNNVLNGLSGTSSNNNINTNAIANGYNRNYDSAANNFNADANNFNRNGYTSNANANTYNPAQYFNGFGGSNTLGTNNNFNGYLDRYNNNINRNLNLNNALSRSPGLINNPIYNNHYNNLGAAPYFNGNPTTGGNNNVGFSTAPQNPSFNPGIAASTAPHGRPLNAAPHPSYNPFGDFTASLAQRKEVHATCLMTPDPQAPFNVTGSVDFVQAVTSLNYPLGLLEVRVQLQGFPVDDGTTDHGMHVHMYGDVTGGCSSAGGHYNPLKSVHGARVSPVRHVGDFGNVREDRQGRVSMVFKDKVASLVGDYSILGRTLIVHEGTDDLGLGGNEGSLKNGNSGSPVACCVIAYAPATSWQGIQSLSIL